MAHTTIAKIMKTTVIFMLLSYVVNSVVQAVLLMLASQFDIYTVSLNNDLFVRVRFATCINYILVYTRMHIL